MRAPVLPEQRRLEVEGVLVGKVVGGWGRGIWRQGLAVVRLPPREGHVSSDWSQRGRRRIFPSHRGCRETTEWPRRSPSTSGRAGTSRLCPGLPCVTVAELAAASLSQAARGIQRCGRLQKNTTSLFVGEDW